MGQDKDCVMHVELRAGDVLNVGGVMLQLQQKKGQVARLVVRAPASVDVKKTQGRAPQGAPSRLICA